jgi:hypothetical protein
MMADCVMVAQRFLEPFVVVRIHLRQPPLLRFALAVLHGKTKREDSAKQSDGGSKDAIKDKDYHE